MTFENYTKPKHRSLSEAKKRKLWNSVKCDDCGKSTENPIVGYKLGKFPVVRDAKVCSSCLEDRIERTKELIRMLKNGEVEL